MMIPKTHSQVLQEVRRLLVEESWTQNVMQRWVRSQMHPLHCIAGALDLACGSSRLQYSRIATLLAKQTVKGRLLTETTAHGTLIAWNDSRRRTKDHVLTLIDKALEVTTK